MSEYPIKFMVYDKEDKELKPVRKISWDCNNNICAVSVYDMVFFTDDEPITLYQFTTAHDSKGKEIYAGHQFRLPCYVEARTGEEIAWYKGVAENPDKLIAKVDITVTVVWDSSIGGYTLRGERGVDLPFWCWAKKIFKEHKIIGHIAVDGEGDPND